jgi:hypothetical protein
MTEQDIRAAVCIAQEDLIGKVARSAEKIDDEQSKSKRWAAHDQLALKFAKRFMRAGGTFLFTQDMRDFGYSTIWEAMAGELEVEGAKPFQKVENAREFESHYRVGCQALNAKLISQWDDAVIFTLPRRENGALIEVITLNPEFIVNEATGATAFEVWQAREKSRAVGQAKATIRKLSRATSAEGAKTLLRDVIDRELIDFTMPRGTLEIENNMLG